MGTVAERWKIEAVLALVRQVEACDFFVAGEYNPSIQQNEGFHEVGGIRLS